MSARGYDILIVGGGQAARRAAEGVKSVSPDLAVGILGEEIHPPYDRPPLSKEALTQGLDACAFRAPDSYAEAGIDLLLGRRVASIDTALRRVRVEDGPDYGYGRLILATGSRVRTLPTRPEVRDRVTTLRTRDDAIRLSAVLTPGARIAIIGAGFIGLEVASSALAMGARPIVIEGAPRILGRGLPQAVAERLLDLHRQAGVDFRLNTPVSDIRLTADNALEIDTVSGVILADHVVVGIGVIPNVELAVEAGLAVNDGLIVDEAGATSIDGIFGAGEVTRHPVDGHEEAQRLESWQAAEVQAEAAGRAAAGAPSPQRTTPWFWSDQAGVNVQVLGRIAETPLIVRDHDDGSAAFFSLNRDGRLSGMVTLGRGADISAGRRLMSRAVALDPAQLADPAFALRRLLS
ncbi:NAD(P)/FAD-dependent oxidoreductase [Brevundimonas sp.]|uniref:NAD(P)/FAD-dependent oxidoreductase n=1 Tax=Brevundimonas sp. TaxID=1871086 RepID=UPI003BAC9B4A